MSNKIRLKLHHGVPNPDKSFWAKLYEGGRRVILTFGDKRTVTIKHEGEEAPIELMCPSVDGRVLRCFLKDGREKFFKTATGLPMIFTADGRATNDLGYQPKFYA